MKADFSGYATKAGLKCTDGRTIMAHAFQKQDKTRVPLVWQHGHSEVTNVLGHAILENREDGVYAYGFFNQSPQAKHAAQMLTNEDINMMSIWANQLDERDGNVIHGVIREVSLVLSGANPGALIESVTIRHSDGSDSDLDGEAIIYTGLPLELNHSNLEAKGVDLTHAEDSDDETVRDIYEAMTDKQKDVVHFMIGEVLSANNGEAKSDEKVVKQSALEDDTESEDSEEESDDTEDSEDESDDDNDSEDESQDETTAEHGNTKSKEGTDMTNVFDTNKTAANSSNTLSHSQLNDIVSMAKSSGSLKSAMEDYGLQHGIENIDLMFPDAAAVSAQPDWIKRRTEWVDAFLSATRKSPFSKIKSLSADITEADARAKGYITGTLKREEYFKVARRVTEPTTIYKKQKLERDDMIDITEYNVVAWLKAEMRIMLDEEVARASLLGDGRDVSSEDKIQEGNIRPIVSDNELFTTVVNVNVSDADSSAEEVIDAIIMNRSKYKGTGTPTFFTTETQLAKFLLVKDADGRRIYPSLAEIAMVLRVSSIVPVEVMEEYPDIVGIMVNPMDYTHGSNKGGEVNMFDDFDIDYNQMKYLIETRLCGALTKPKSAIVIKSVDAAAVLVSPVSPAFNASTGALTIPTVTGVTYRNANGDVIDAAGSPYTVPSGEDYMVFAEPSSSAYYFATSDDDDWTFTAD